jgi:hypothetical protein
MSTHRCDFDTAGSSCLECHDEEAGASVAESAPVEHASAGLVPSKGLIPPLSVDPPSLWRERHWFLGCTTLSLIAWACTTLYLFSLSAFLENLRSIIIDGTQVTVPWWWLIPAILYFAHLTYSATTSTKHCIDNKSDAEESKFFLQNLMTAPPEVFWRVRNYHISTYTNDEGDHEKIVTSIKTARAQVTSHVDKSNVNVDLMTAYPITLLSLSEVSACVSCALVHAVSGPDRVCA